MKTIIKTGLLALMAIFLLSLGACQKKLDKMTNDDVTNPNDVNIDNLQASSSFNWENSQTATVLIYTKDNADNPVANVKVSILSDFEENNGREIINGVTNDQGVLELDYNFEADMREVVVATDFIGFIPSAKVPVIDGKVVFTFGGSRQTSLKQEFIEASVKSIIENTLKNTLNTNVQINYIGTYNSIGVPNYLEPEGDYLSPAFLHDINSALPEHLQVPQYHPEYLMGVNEHNLIVLDDADVWITFVTEGAGYKNVLAYYTYDRDFPPSSPQEITQCTVIFPNASLNGAGGGLFAGDKVYLGTFSANTVIGWMLLRNGWNSTTQQSTEGLGLLYSNLELNPEPIESNKQHCVTLYDEERELFVIGFEDMIRPACDNDFNDAVFYATANPIENIEIENIQPAYPDPIDTDGDGIYDNFDDYPEDPELAFNNYYASSGLFGTLAFEDLWPSKGDYDFNDLVIDYNYNRISNAQNEVVTLRGRFVVRAIGASFKNGFGFTIEGLSPSAIASIEGTQLLEDYIITSANGTEANQTDATIIVFDNAWNHGHGNTRPDQPFIVPDTITVDIHMVNPIPVAEFGNAPFNPFIIVNMERGKEVHLPDYEPTDLVDASYFGKSFDDSQPAIGKYYKTVENLPWALNFPSKFDYPIETVSIDLGHLKFVPWVLSNGTEYRDWYKDLDGYRNDANIYQE